MQTAGSLLLIYVVSVLIAYFATPEDPWSFLIAQVVFAAFGGGAFVLGRISSGARQTETASAP